MAVEELGGLDERSLAVKFGLLPVDSKVLGFEVLYFSVPSGQLDVSLNLSHKGCPFACLDRPGFFHLLTQDCFNWFF